MIKDELRLYDAPGGAGEHLQHYVQYSLAEAYLALTLCHSVLEDDPNRYGKTLFLRKEKVFAEALNGPMSSLIRVFIQKSALVASLDQEIAVFTGGSVVISASTGGWDSRIDQAWLNLLNIGNESDLTGILLQNAPYLQLRCQSVYFPKYQLLYRCSDVLRTVQ
ncbi:hypothetical protein GZD23_004025 [Salmonella enterica subsp. enterica]|nr:hypothetical protein [Salmonella enterica subsp. enterica serovar Okatie]EBI7260578.1 hypothetical protein [Salmonella enterica]EBY2986090.1 hypothetical protein [Salmonella enterica subsp. enterica serovar Durban]ECC9158737.1 hypothetical protein [Salmonella enterica subsp. salamae]ECV3919466.1 hypothetical protein [Salmonella enterica subsp. enterica serovar O rough]EEG3130280.1 hypothetical protein [Salmonella enterica subsp. enterica serovar Nima]EIV1999648.1 hypothetical protein [Salm